MADYADTASLSSSRSERSAPSKRRASSTASSDPSFDSPELPPVAGSADPHALRAEPTFDAAALASTAEEAEGAPVRQGTLSGFETPELAQDFTPTGEEAIEASPVAGATANRRAPRAKRTAAPAAVEAAETTPLAAAEEPVLMEPQLHAETGDGFDASPRAETAHPLAYRLDALQSAVADQRRIAAVSSRQLKWVLGTAAAAVLASVGFGVAQSVRFDSFANESRAEQARLEQFILKQQSTLDDLTQRLATPPAAPVAAVEPASVAPARHAAPRPAHAAHAHRAQKAAH
jgi:hypothetical protein